MRPYGEEIGEVAHLLDADLLALLLPGLGALLLRLRGHALGHEKPEIGVIALGEPAARPAATAGPAVGPSVLAQQGAGKGLGELELAPAVPALHEHRVGKI